MGRCSFPWLRQFQVTLTKNRKILIRRPFHLTLLLLSSVASVIFAWLAGRDARGPQGDFPPLNECGMVESSYYQNLTANVQDGAYYELDRSIPISLNEPWRGGLPVFLMALGPLATAVSAFMILREELVSCRWGALRSAGLRDSAHWVAWLVAFAVPSFFNSIAGGITAVALPQAHAFESVNFGSVFVLLLFLNLALVAASFFLAAVCGTVNSTTLSVFVIMAMIVASSVPFIVTASNNSPPSPGESSNAYSYSYRTGGAFWAYDSTMRTTYEYWGGEYKDQGQWIRGESTIQQCELPIVSLYQGHFYKTPEEQNEVAKEEIFQGCIVQAGASSAFSHKPRSFLFWFFLPKVHFLSAWSNILGYTALPGNTFSFAQAGKSPELLAQESLLNFKNGEEPLFDPANTNGTSLFSQGSTVVLEQFIPMDYWSYSYDDQISNCPSTSVSNVCSGSRNCRNPLLGYPSSSSPSANDCVGFLTSLVVIYILLSIYWVKVFPMANGSSMKFYFPLLPSYWCGKRRGIGSKSDEGEGNESSGVAGQIGVEAVDVRKSYGKVEALKPFSIKMKVGEVTALLGHNGAGKSTFVNLLCCEKNPTSGDIFVFGRSVTMEQHAVRSMVGECKQDDYLWPSLSARDHLELFGGIRYSNMGTDPADLPVVVQKWLDSVDLDIVQNDYSSSYSGGMKRRLSVAIATIGDAPVVVLDEPTTGMDPVSRRFVWKHIDSIKSGRVVLLTTHAMEEADLLSDNVAIMCDGTLSAIGTPIELKTQYGSALEFKLITGQANVLCIGEKIMRQFEDCQAWINVETSDSGFITLNIKKVRRDDEAGGGGVPLSTLSEFIGWLEKEDSSVDEYGFSNSSLEEVFLAVTHQAGPSNTAVANNDIESKRCCRCCCCCCTREYHKTAEAIIADNNTTPEQGSNLVQQPKANLSDYARSLSVKTQTLAIIRFFMARNWSGKPSIINWVVFGFFCGVNMICGFGMVVLWGTPGIHYMLIVTVFLLSLMLVSIVSPIYSDRNSGLFKMMCTQGMLDKSFLIGTSLYSFAVQFLYTFVFLTLFFATNIFRKAIRPDCGDSYTDGYYYSDDYYCGYARFGDKPTVSPYSRTLVLSGTHEGTEVSVYAHQTSGGYEMILGIIVIFSLTVPGAVLSSSFLPGYRLPLVFIAIVIIAVCCSPGILLLMQQLDIYFYQNCIETVTATYDCSQEAFSLDNANKDFVNCVGWQIADPLIYCSPVAASILPQIGVFHTLSLTLMSDIVFYSEPEGYAEEVFVPSLDGATCTGNSCHFPYARQMYGKSLGFMFLGAVLLLILGIGMAYLLLYTPGFIRHARHVLCRFFDCSRTKGSSEPLDTAEEFDEVIAERNRVNDIMQPILSKPIDLEANNDVPVLSNLSSSCRKELPLVLSYKLRKVFPSLGGAPPKVALKSLDLQIPKGQVLGLLGKNGAGKTTALKILAGMHDATSGIGLVAGYNVDDERLAVYERLGNCPQFDCVWRDQSVQSHLNFYARLKGIENPTKAAREIATAVGLGAPEVFTRPSGNLSGGMRRRLSIAVSLLGSPAVCLLDEPTTGLDPSTRNEIWGLISSFCTADRALIITTHMMIEADTLCSRIAIVAKGALKVVGTQQHLKGNYGSGYLLQLNLVQSNEESISSVLQYVRSNISAHAEIVTKQAKTIHINLPRDVSVQRIFTTLYSEESASMGVNQFLVSQSSLEDVFIALGE